MTSVCSRPCRWWSSTWDGVQGSPPRVGQIDSPASWLSRIGHCTRLWQSKRQEYISYFEILYNPLILLGHHFQAVVDKVVELCRDADNVNGADVQAVEHALSVTGHREAVLVVAEITAIIRRKYIDFEVKKN